LSDLTNDQTTLPLLIGTNELWGSGRVICLECGKPVILQLCDNSGIHSFESVAESFNLGIAPLFCLQRTQLFILGFKVVHKN
jgi:hypothetical protein